jgi:hypothetical protein
MPKEDREDRFQTSENPEPANKANSNKIINISANNNDDSLIIIDDK